MTDYRDANTAMDLLDPRDASQARRLLIVDDDYDLLEVLAATFRDAGFSVETALSAEQGLIAFERNLPSAALVDVNLPGLDGFAFLEAARERAPDVPVLMLSGYGGVDDAARAVAAGASSYLMKPIDSDGVTDAVRDAIKNVRGRADIVAASATPPERPSSLVGTSPAMVTLRGLIEEIAPTRCAVLVYGETGTGKELVARALHAASGRSGAFVAVNCAAFPDGLIESALFGHERGAFTGALRRELGAFERAHRGTLLLDEITEMRPDLQAKLLRVLQEGEIQRVGGQHPIRLDVRVVATTNRDPEAAVKEGILREDLLYRLDGVRLRVPALRDRPMDIPLLAGDIVRRAAEEFGRPEPSIAPGAIAALQREPWPGNVRQLQHVLQRAVIFARHGVIAMPQLHEAPPSAPVAPTPAPTVPAPSNPAAAHEARAVALPTLHLAELERLAINAAMDSTGGNRSRAASLLGINVRSLRRILNERFLT
ncbi:MAG TPA: sigma-54 dependent transcriptional regulator [Gemmatimonadaceae bacterium]|nr:sigma-54 dependent transcriptional regulator [Gemmatimonadaceae bacterium]